MNNVQFNPEIKRYYEDISNQFLKILNVVILDVYADDFDDFWEAKYNYAKDLIENENNDKSFFFKTLNDNLKRYNKDYNEKTDFNKIYNASLEWSPQERLYLLDFQCVCKDLLFNKSIKERFLRDFDISEKFFNNKLYKCITLRNNFTHENEKIVGTAENLNSFIDSSKPLVKRIAKKYSQNDRVNQYCEKFYELCNNYKWKAGLPPVDLDFFSEKNGVDHSIMLKIIKKHNIKFDEGLLYGISEDELIVFVNDYEKSLKFDATQAKLSETEKILDETKSKGIINEQKIDEIRRIVNADSPLITEFSSEITQNAIKQAFLTQREDKSAEIVENVIKQINITEFRYLNNYKQGILSRQELEELLLNYNIFADASAFLNKSTRKFITKTLIPFKLLHYKDKFPLFLHRSFRNEIYELAHADVNEEFGITLDEISNAKNALLTINELRAKGYLCILGKISNYDDSTELLFDLLSEYKTNRFCILTQDSSIAQSVAETGTKTLCAVKTVIDDLMIWSSSKNNVKADHKEYLCELLMKRKRVELESDNRKVTLTNIDFSSESNTKSDELSNNKQIIESFENDQSSNISDEVQNINLIKNSFINEKVSDISIVPTVGSTVYNRDGQNIYIKAEIGRGGEGTVFETNDKNIVVKIYHKDNRSQTNYEKLKLMINSSPNNTSIIWPLEIVYNHDGDYVGFTMKKTPSYCKQIGESVLKINFSKIRQTMFPNWNREDLIKTCISITNIFSVLHDFGVLMGDVNPANILINPNDAKEVYFVDCDSYQIGDFLCPVGTPIFTSPEYYKRCNMKPVYSKEKRTIDDEKYSLATLIFEILMNGQAPFASKSTEKKNIVDDICNYRFSFKTKESTGEDTPDGPYRMIWNNMDISCKTKFTKVFEGNSRYSAKEWNSTLYYYLNQVKEGKSTNELIPKKYVDKNNSFVDFICSCCGKEANVHKDVYERIMSTYKDNPLLFCNTCRGIMSNIIDETVVCDFCNKAYHPSFGEEWRHQKLGYKYKCHACRKK